MSSLPSLASTLFPGSGYFGSAAGDPLVVRLDNKARRLRLQIDTAASPQFLNLQGITFYEDGRLVKPPVVAVRQSSVYKDGARFGPEGLLTGGGIHSKSEASPWWEVEFAEPLQASEVRISNRRDQWGQRASALRLLLLRQDGNWSVPYDALSVDEHLANLVAAARLSAGRYAFRDDDPAAMREALLRASAEAVLSPDTDLSSIAWRRVLALVDLWGPAELSRAEAYLLAARLHASNGLDPIFAFASKLKTRSSIQMLQTRINEVAAVRSKGSFVITRHGVQRSRLVSERQAFLRVMHEVMRILAEVGRSPVVAYGTLLGAVRDGAFIPHDDDVDILYRCASADRGLAEREVHDIKALMTRAGYTVSVQAPNFNMHVLDTKSGAEIDLFPTWVSDGRAFLYMERMAIRSINANLLYPAGRVTLYGESFAAPADATGFLTERYGPTWQTPDVFFEWPWALLNE